MIRKIKSGVILELWLQKIPIKIKSGRCVLMCIYLVRAPCHIYIAYILYYANALEMENSAITNKQVLTYEYLLDYLNFLIWFRMDKMATFFE